MSIYISNLVISPFIYLLCLISDFDVYLHSYFWFVHFFYQFITTSYTYIPQFAREETDLTHFY